MARTKSRPKRWEEAATRASAALEELLSIQEEYQDWRDGLPENLECSATAELLDAVVEIDLQDINSQIEDAANTDLPRGFGRD